MRAGIRVPARGNQAFRARELGLSSAGIRPSARGNQTIRARGIQTFCVQGTRHSAHEDSDLALAKNNRRIRAQSRGESRMRCQWEG